MLIFSSEGGKLLLLEDQYDEGPLTGMRTIEESLHDWETNEEPEEAFLSNMDFAIPNGVSFVYNPAQAANYAKKFVNPAAKFRSGTPCFENYYNPEYRISSADCTNYVSQAAYFGGLPMTSKWYYNDNGSKCNDPSHKARKLNEGHGCTDDDVRSPAWVNVSSLKDALVGIYATLKENPVITMSKSVI